MQLRSIAVLVVTGLAMAGQPNPPTDPITDRLRFEIAVAQRDYVLAKQQYDAAMERLRAKTAEAEALCKTTGKTFAPDRFACVGAKKGVSDAVR
jgi:hypothetical protein